MLLFLYNAERSLSEYLHQRLASGQLAAARFCPQHPLLARRCSAPLRGGVAKHKGLAVVNRQLTVITRVLFSGKTFYM